ncbi:MAG: hypothetical protein U0P47_07175 [Acidimicrobiales bacterium]
MNAPTCLDKMCVYSFGNSPIQVSGDFNGVAVSAGAGAPLPVGGFGGTGYSVFTGTAAVCGAGSGSVGWTDRVIQGVDGRDRSTWEIVDGSGSGALAHLKGRGVGIAGRSSVAADGSGRSEVEGTVSCG